MKTESVSNTESRLFAVPTETPESAETPTYAPLNAKSSGDWYASIVEAYAAFELSNHTVYDESIISKTLLEDGLNNVKCGFPTASYTYTLLDLNGSGEEVLLIGWKDYPVDFDCIYAYKDGEYEMILQSEYFRNSLRMYTDSLGGYIIDKVDNSGDTSEHYIYTLNENNEAVLLNHFSLHAEKNTEDRNPHVASIYMAVGSKEMEITFDEYNVYMEQYGMRGIFDSRQPHLISYDWKPVKDYNK